MRSRPGKFAEEDMRSQPEIRAPGAGRPRAGNSFPFALPSIGEEEIAEVVDTLRSGWITTGPKVSIFEKEFLAAYVQSGNAAAVNSCTAGLHVALAALGVGPGDAGSSCPPSPSVPRRTSSMPPRGTTGPGRYRPGFPGRTRRHRGFAINAAD